MSQVFCVLAASSNQLFDEELDVDLDEVLDTCLETDVWEDSLEHFRSIFSSQSLSSTSSSSQIPSSEVSSSSEHTLSMFVFISWCWIIPSRVSCRFEISDFLDELSLEKTINLHQIFLHFPPTPGIFLLKWTKKIVNWSLFETLHLPVLLILIAMQLPSKLSVIFSVVSCELFLLITTAITSELHCLAVTPCSEMIIRNITKYCLTVSGF